MLGRLSRGVSVVEVIGLYRVWCWVGYQGVCLLSRLQWTLANPNSLGPEPIQISEIFGLVKATAATCVIVTAPYLHSV